MTDDPGPRTGAVGRRGVLELEADDRAEARVPDAGDRGVAREPLGEAAGRVLGLAKPQGQRPGPPQCEEHLERPGRRAISPASRPQRRQLAGIAGDRGPE